MMQELTIPPDGVLIQLEVLEKSISSTEELIDRLYSRLEPVTYRRDVPSNAESQKEQVDYPIGAKIQNLDEAVRRTNERLIKLLGLLAL